MKTAKLVIGIISIILSLFVLFQSCVAGLANTMYNNGEVGGSVGMILAFCLLVAGIVAIATRSSPGNGGFVAAGFYIAGGIIAFLLAGGYGDFYIWSVLSIIFGAIFAIWDTKKELTSQ
ncbi:hypothetical protein JZO86_09855 [Enterococcus ureasiticus]|uniref:hypothetical protein n=1 Tax=Enterococcus ureasiticus TaxID=903984 RepID=UPI001A8FBE64|nr:hypothetical protein [Enterococcus ureasiticus]MBO0474003.1 hypothetical protein [Enterococcus ureasiticus]